jgi:proteasome assembly chaperone (PAC2) family protein
MSKKPWKELQFIKQIIIKPENAKNPMWVEFKDESDYEDVFDLSSSPRMLIHRDRSIKLVANAMYEVQMDYPEDFKKLVVATGDLAEACKIYQALQRKALSNWTDYTQESVW